jgi:hypothetical protein
MKYIIHLLLFAIWIGSGVVFLWYQYLAIFIVLLISLVMLALGFFPPRLSFNGEFSMYKALEFAPPTHAEIRVFGQELRQNPLLRVSVRVWRLEQLIAVAFICGSGAFYLAAGSLLTRRTDRLSEDISALLMLLFVLCLVPLIISGRYLAEQFSIRLSVMALGFVTREKNGSVEYEFRNEAGEHFGGTAPLIQPIGMDNALLLFVNPVLGTARPQCTFRFHRFKLLDQLNN